MPSPLLFGGIIYLLKTNTGILSAYDAKTGAPHFQLQRLEHAPEVFASPVGAAGRVYITARDGVTVVIRNAPAFEVLAENHLSDGFDASPALVGSDIYMRGYKYLYLHRRIGSVGGLAALAGRSRRAVRMGWFSLLVASVLALGGQAAAPASARVIMLGTGSPVPDPQAQGPATAIAIGSRLFLVDAGAGVTRQLAAAGFPRIKQVEATFITHLHSDHTLGYPDVIFTTWIMGRREPLLVFGPPGLKRMTDRIMDTWREDLDIRIKGLERETEAWLKVDAREIAPGVIYDKEGVRVTAIGVKHGDWRAFAYRFDTPGKTITISGDTSPTEALVQAAKGSDVLIHEVYDAARVKPENRPGGEFWPRVHARVPHVERGARPARGAGAARIARPVPRAAHGRHGRGAAGGDPRGRLRRPRCNRARPRRLLTTRP